MLKLAGMILLMTGCVGFGINRVLDEKRRIRELREIRKIILRVQSEMVYGKRTLPEICLMLGQYMEEPYRQAFTDIFKRMEKNDGSILSDIWYEEMRLCMKGLPLKEDEKEILTKLPALNGIIDETNQAQNIGRSIDIIDERIRRAESEYEGKSRVIFSISVMAGLFLVILLL